MRTCASELTMPPSTGVASGFMTSAPVEWLHMIGSRLATTVDTVITFGRSRSSAPSVTASSSAAARQPAAQLLALARHRFLEIDHHDHAVCTAVPKSAMKPTQTATEKL